MITNSKAIILRCIDYQESSKILTLLTPDHGKIAVIARGAKKPKSKYGGILESGNLVDVVYYYKPNRGIQSLSEASAVYANIEFRKDFQKAAILYATLELISQLVHENEVNDTLYGFLVSFIPWLGEEDNVHPSVFCYIQIRCAELIGFGLGIENDKPEDIAYLNIADGTISNSPVAELSYKLSVIQTRFIREAISNKQRSIFRLGLENSELRQLIHHLDVYFKYHIEGYQDRRSDSIFEKMI